jgi:hypothetical protein
MALVVMDDGESQGAIDTLLQSWFTYNCLGIASTSANLDIDVRLMKTRTSQRLLDRSAVASLLSDSLLSTGYGIAPFLLDAPATSVSEAVPLVCKLIS